MSRQTGFPVSAADYPTMPAEKVLEEVGIQPGGCAVGLSRSSQPVGLQPQPDLRMSI